MKGWDIFEKCSNIYGDFTCLFEVFSSVEALMKLDEIFDET